MAQCQEPTAEKRKKTLPNPDTPSRSVGIHLCPQQFPRQIAHGQKLPTIQPGKTGY
jgi:hypothetical protein